MGFYNNIGNSAIEFDLTRIIHPVGQGAFYSESFNGNNFNFLAIYDCGGDKISIERELNYLAINRNSIDVMFLSHFHSDHMNGIPRILAKFKEGIKDFYFPFLTPELFALDVVYNYLVEGKDSISNQFLINFIRYFFDSKEKEIKEKDKKSYSNIKNVHVFKGERVVVSSIESVWQYELHRPNYLHTPTDKIKSLLLSIINEQGLVDSITKDYINEETYDQLSVVIDNSGDFEKLKERFLQEFKGEQNQYSMMVFSKKSDRIELLGGSPCNRCNCLYTGDVPASKSTINIVKSIDYDIIQVPHHGSIKNYSKDLYKDGTYAFFSAGKNNRYGHPDLETRQHLLGLCKYNPLVTEEPNSRVVLEYIFIGSQLNKVELINNNII